jgi:predicted PurR-regulated permease PerM
MVAIYLFFMLLEFSTLRQTFADLVPSGQRDNLKDFLGQLDSTMSSYFRAQGLISLILAACFALGFSLISLPLGILFGALTGLATMVPYLQIATLPFALLLCLLQSIDQGVPFWQAALLVLLVYGICQILQDFLLVPRILGNISGLSPVMIMLSLSVWGKLLGMLGLILAIPLTCLALVYYRRLARHDS